MNPLHRAQLDLVIHELQTRRVEAAIYPPHGNPCDAPHELLDAYADAEEGAEEQAERTAEWLRASLEAFRSMRNRDRDLTPKQLSWIEKVADHLEIVLPRPPVPRGREVEMMFKPGPLSPPGRKST